MTTAALVGSLLLTGVVRKFALRRGVLDVPNARSSHLAPTPRGGGVAIVLTTTASLVILAVFRILPVDLFAALGGGGAVVALVGFLDDRGRLPASVRLVVHFAAAGWALAWLDGLPSLQVGHQLISFGWTGYILGSLGIVWVLNLFNFMDGIDGIAASEAIFIASAGALIASLTGSSGAISAIALAFAAGCVGFLAWNWPPAKIFMGDAGSGYIGYVIAVLALAAARNNPIGLWIWLILGGVFFVDATVTLTRRLLSRERVYEAHRSHAYQWLARKWESHVRVTIIVIIVNVLWLFPCALVATLYPRFAGWIAVFALAPLAVAAFAAGAGRSEMRPSR